MKRLPLLLMALLIAFLAVPHPAYAAARSTQITFVNHTPNTLVKVRQDLSHGEWSSEPPDTIYAGTEVSWASESNGFATGTEGWVRYALQRTTPPPTIPDAETFYMHWDNPFVGSNSYDEAVPAGREQEFGFKREGGGGSDANVKWTLNSLVGGLLDSDGDSIPDDWEQNGVSIQPNGTGAAVFVDLPKMGADPNKPDIFIQTDWMQDATHNQQLDPLAIQTIVQAFNNAPYMSPTGSRGINLHVDNGPGSILDFNTGATWGNLSQAKSVAWADLFGTVSTTNCKSPYTYNWYDFQAVKDTNFIPTGRSPIFHYVIVAHKHNACGNGGISRNPDGDDFFNGTGDFIISLGGFTGGMGTIDEQAGALMHELGHNLGLGHGGSNHDNYKPNYLSIMNYAFSVDGLIVGGVLGVFDYSRAALAPLDETNLNEALGVAGAPSGYGTLFACPGQSSSYPVLTSVPNADSPINWNCNTTGGEAGVHADINFDKQQSTLPGFDDWAHIKFNGGAVGAAGAAPLLPLVTEQIDIDYTPELAARVRAATRPQTALTYTGGAPGQNGWLVTPAVVTLSASDPLGNAIAYSEYSFDNQSWTRYGGPFTLPEGRFTLFYRSQNTVGVLEDAKQQAFQIDTVAPQSALSIGLPQYASGPPPVIPSITPLTITATDATAGVQAVTYRFFLQGSTPPAYTTQAGNAAQFNLVGADGVYEVDTFAIDNAGNPEAPHVQFIRLANTRVLNGLQSLYTFEEGSGTVVHDVAGVGPVLNLELNDAAAVHWSSGGLVISRTAVLASDGPARLVTEAISTTGELSLEAWVVPAASGQNDLARILTLSDDHSQRNIELLSESDGGQRRYSVRLRTSETTSSARPPLRTRAGAVTPTIQHVVYTRDALGLAHIYVDGVEQAGETTKGDLSTWDASYHLVLGNTLLGDRPWLGEYQLVALYHRALSPAEVRQNYQAGPSGATTPSATPELQSLYTFREGSGATAHDVSGKGFPADLVVSDTAAIHWGSDGLTLDVPTVVSSHEPATKVISASIATGELSIEAWVTPATTERDAGRIATISNDHSRRNAELFVELNEDAQTMRYAARQRTSKTSSSGRRLAGSFTQSTPPALQHVVYTRDALGVARLYVNGIEQAQQVVRGDLSTWDASYHLVLGNTLRGDRPWLGTYHRVAFYNRALSPAEVHQHFREGLTTDGAQ